MFKFRYISRLHYDCEVEVLETRFIEEKINNNDKKHHFIVNFIGQYSSIENYSDTCIGFTVSFRVNDAYKFSFSGIDMTKPEEEVLKDPRKYEYLILESIMRSRSILEISSTEQYLAVQKRCIDVILQGLPLFLVSGLRNMILDYFSIPQLTLVHKSLKKGILLNDSTFRIHMEQYKKAKLCSLILELI